MLCMRSQTQIRRILLGLGIVIILFVSQKGLLPATRMQRTAMDLFIRGDIHVETDRRVGRLLATGGTATVSGVVEKGIVVVDGNLVLTAEAHIKGTVIVLGGAIEREPSAIVEKAMFVLSPINVPIADFVVFGLLCLGLASVVTIPVAIWITVQFIKKNPPQAWLCLKQQLTLVERHWAARYLVVVVSTRMLLLTFFAEMTWETLFRHQLDFFDNLLIWLVQYLATPQLDHFMIVISKYGFGVPFWIIIAIALLWLIHYRRWLEAAGFVICLLGEALLNFLLKSLFERSRPDVFQLVEAAGYSFPSGHAMVSLCLYGMIAFLLARHIANWRGRLTVVVLAATLVAAIGVSRVYLGVHYPTDVIAGYFAGGMWLTFSISLILWREERYYDGRKPYL